MTEPDDPPVAAEAPAGAEYDIEIVRDPTFSRFVADEAFVSDLGRDLEVAFLQYGPLLVGQEDAGDYVVSHSRKVVTEVARMRMSYPSMVTFVVSFLRSGIAAGKLNGEAITKSLRDWPDEVEDEDSLNNDQK